MTLHEYRPATAFPGLTGRAFDQSSPAWAATVVGSPWRAASVIGWLVATALQQRDTRHQSAPASASG